MAQRALPDDPVTFIQQSLRRGQVFWTYHVNMRLGQRFIFRNTILAAEGYEVIEAYPDDNVRVVTAYCPNLEEWEQDLKTRRIP